ncbi:ABC transporter ATP-binding protein [Rhodococcus sp. SORGH_AS_0303]|uniref:iron ABC transporter ATP-binding protein n=1 Tax=Rhodococcus sp. SORGH_AS_0303 TaxID=3041753 RepID=UPI00278B83B3|nr:ATP-binding cassette domain-containing protein [Rhodococcus sp. SORGH_AS_0303]MDQ1203185.1 iron complex transport system ATP-binding protein [Rhodococcus sp. SORGH_AS_0303]
MITFSDVSKTYQGETVLGPVSGTIAAGGITSVVGPNGAGKSTLLSIMGRLLEPTTGTVTIGGAVVQHTATKDLARIVSVLRQDNHLTARLTIRELVSFGRFPHCGGRLGAHDHEHVDRALDFLHLDILAGRHLDQVSGGQRQRAFVAMVLAQDTPYVLLDEPLNNLDMKHSVAMMGHLRRAADELGRTIVLVVHDINFAAAWSDDIVAMRDGRIVVSGPAGAIMHDDILSDVFDTRVRVHDIDGARTAVYARPRNEVRTAASTQP